jgi:hypothetical protein
MDDQLRSQKSQKYEAIKPGDLPQYHSSWRLQPTSDSSRLVILYRERKGRCIEGKVKTKVWGKIT